MHVTQLTCTTDKPSQHRHFQCKRSHEVSRGVFLFSVLLTGVIFYTVNYYYVDRDSLLDAHELYFYSDLVNRWNFPADTINMKSEIDNLHFIVNIFQTYGNNSSLVWSYPYFISPENYFSDGDSDYLEELHDVSPPLFSELSEGNLLPRKTTRPETGRPGPKWRRTTATSATATPLTPGRG